MQIQQGPISDANTFDNIETSLNIIDDWDESDRTKVNLIQSQPNGVRGGAGTATTDTLRVVMASDYGLATGTSYAGAFVNYSVNPVWNLQTMAVTATGDTTIIAASASVKSRVHLMIVENLDTTDATDVHFEEGSSTIVITGLEKKYIPAYGGQKVWDHRGKGVAQATAGSAIQINVTGSDNLTVWTWYTTE